MDFSIQSEWNFHSVKYTQTQTYHNESGEWTCNVLKRTATENEAEFKGASLPSRTRAFSNSHLFDAIVVYINTHEIIKNYDYVYAPPR